MNSDRRHRKPLLEGRSVWRLDDVCRQRGLARDQLEELIQRGCLDEAVLFDEQGRPVLLFEDLVPTREGFTRLLERLEGPDQ